MSVDEATPSETPRSVIDRLLPRTLADLEERLASGGVKSVRHQCSACGHRDTFDVDTGQDPELLVKAISMLSATQARIGSQDDDSTAAAVKLLADRSDLTDAELAEYIAKLEAELASS